MVGLVSIESDIQSACFPISLNVFIDLANIRLEILLIILIVSDKSSQTLFPLELRNLFIEVLNLRADILLDFLALLPTVDTLFAIFCPYLINQLVFILFKTFLYHMIQLFFALSHLLSYIVGQTDYVVAKLSLN